MANARDSVRHTLSKISNMNPGSNQSAAIKDVVSGLEVFVTNAKAEKQLENELPDLEDEIVRLEEERSDPDIEPGKKKKIERELSEARQLVQKALEVKQNSGRMRAVINDLEAANKNLREAIESYKRAS